MLSVLSNTTYRRLFLAQIIALLGTGLLTVALSLLAYDLAGARAGVVLGTAYAIKMVAYVGLAPLASALVQNLPRKAVLIGADVMRAAVALSLPFISEIWHIYVLIFLLQTASATFTPTFQAVIPDVLPDEGDYTRALSLSRLAYDLENLMSPVIAGLLLTFVTYNWLFMGTVLGFVGSALLVLMAVIPSAARGAAQRPFRERLTRGTSLYLATPRLRGLLSLNLTAAAASAFVLVNTVVLVRDSFGGDARALAVAMGAYGAGSMLAALVLPRWLDSRPDRAVMMPAGLALAVLTLAQGAFGGVDSWGVFLALWSAMGFLFAAILTPSGRLLRRSAHAEDRPAIFAAQFALSHACWLVTYPLAGWVGQTAGLPMAMLVLGAIGLAGWLSALILWPKGTGQAVTHAHPELPRDHPHLAEHRDATGQHRHAIIIDDEHRAWPTQG